MINKLVIAPHADDEVLGCGGLLDENSFVYYCGIDEDHLSPDPKYRIGLEARLKEIEAVSNHLKFSWRVNEKSKVNKYKKRDFIGIFEDLINEFKPEFLFMPHKGSYNQDHKEIYEALQVSLRPHDKNFFVKKVLLYEQPHLLLWPNEVFTPNYFVPIDLQKKIKGYNLHLSQVRKMRSQELLESMARIRGAQANCDYGEAFEIQRWVE